MRKIKIFIALLIASVFFTLIPENTYADPLDGWPKQSPVAPQYLQVLKEDRLSVFDCGRSADEGRMGEHAQAFMLEGLVQYSSTYAWETSQYSPMLSPCLPSRSSLSTPDGTLYTGVHKAGSNPTNAIIAEKNGQVLWEASVEMACPSSASNKYGSPRVTEIGADGLVYTILKPNYT